MDTFFLIFHIFGYFFWTGSLLTIVIVLPVLQIYLDKDPIRELGQRFIQKISYLIYSSGALILISGLFYQAAHEGERLQRLPFFLLEVNLLTNIFIVICSGILLALSRRVSLSLEERVLHIDLLAKRLSNYHSTSILILLLVLSVVTLKLINY